MTKTMSIRFEDHVAALIAERAKRDGISINQAVNEAVVRAAEVELDEVRAWTRETMTKYQTVMDRLG